MTKAVLVSAVSFLILISCGNGGNDPRVPSLKGNRLMNVVKEPFGSLPDGAAIDLYTLTNANGLRVGLITYGATLVFLEVPDRKGALSDIVLGHDHIEGYVTASPYFGSTIGRFGNRIAGGRFVLDGVTYELATNDGAHHLHGGLKGFDKVVWNADPVREPDAVGVRFSYLSPDGEEGYPGNLRCTVVYALTSADELRISYEAETDRATPINLTHHSYFNLAGAGTRDILNNVLTIEADAYLPVDAGLIPTGEIAPVRGTPMDFTSPAPIGSRIEKVEGGYDHCYALRSPGGELALAATVFEPETGRVMEILTTEPGLQFYSGNFLDGTITGKGGRVYHKHFGFCLETQRFPDSPNKPQFPSTILEPGTIYRSLTVHRFSTR